MYKFIWWWKCILLSAGSLLLFSSYFVHIFVLTEGYLCQWVRARYPYFHFLILQKFYQVHPKDKQLLNNTLISRTSNLPCYWIKHLNIVVINTIFEIKLMAFKFFTKLKKHIIQTKIQKNNLLRKYLLHKNIKNTQSLLFK